MTTPGVTGDWSVIDILAHIAAWQRYLLIHLQAAIRNEEPADIGFTGDGDTDTMNARFYEQNKVRPLDNSALVVGAWCSIECRLAGRTAHCYRAFPTVSTRWWD